MEFNYIGFTDGSAKKKSDFMFNAGAATVLLDNNTKNVYQKGKALPDKTNNYAELYAVLLTFEMIKSIKAPKEKANVLIISDSRYVVDMFNSWVFSWAKDKKKDDQWTTKSGKLSNERLIKHIYYEFIINDKYNVTFVHMNSHKKMTDEDIRKIKNKIEKQGFSINKDTVKVFIKYNKMADELADKYSSNA